MKKLLAKLLDKFPKGWRKRLTLAELTFIAIIIFMIAVSSVSCGMMPSLGWGSPPVQEVAAPAVPKILSEVSPTNVTENLWRFGWLSILLVFVFPGARKPILSLWTAVFQALSIPFLAVRRWYDHRYKS